MRKRIVFSLMASILLLLSACGSIPGMEGGSSSGGSASSSDGTYHVGDTISTAFFDFTVNSAVASADHEGYTAQDGYKLVVADLTIKNTETYSMPMGQYDFMIAWGDGDEDFAYPLNQYCESQLGLMSMRFPLPAVRKALWSLRSPLIRRTLLSALRSTMRMSPSVICMWCTLPLNKESFHVF